MSDSFRLEDLAGRLGLACQAGEAGELQVERHGLKVRIGEAAARHLDPGSALGRHLIWGVFFGVRLGIDHLLCEYDPGEERAGHQALYGERLPRLVSGVTLGWFEALVGQAALTADWLVDSLQVAYIYETGKYLHTLTHSDLGATPISAEKVRADAHHALFYEAYRLKPAEKIETPEGLIRVFRTTEGLGASRAQLLPDFDYDAAREAGSFAIPCRDTMIIGRPAACDFADLVREEVARVSGAIFEQAAFPLTPTIFQMTHDQAFARDGAPRFHDLPSYQDAINAVMPGEDLQVDSP